MYIIVDADLHIYTGMAQHTSLETLSEQRTRREAGFRVLDI